MPKLTKKSAKKTEDSFLPKALRIATIAFGRKALDIKAYDVRGLTLVADAFVLCSTSSEPHFRAVFNAVSEEMKDVGVRPLHKEGTFSGGWMVLDYGTVILHIFREQARQFYDLDGLWADAPEIALDLDE